MGALRLLAMVTLGLLITVGAAALAATQSAAEKIDVTPAKADRPVTLRDRLVVGLEARLKSEVAFCDAVALKVRTGQLPQRLVDETFFWARDRAGVKREGHTRRPIIYFQPAMLARANKLHITL